MSRNVPGWILHFSEMEKSPVAVTTPGVSAKGFGKKRGRKEDLRGVRKEAAHGFRNLSVIRVLFGFEHRITET